MQVVIDSNVYLSFYHFSGEDLEELEKILHLVEGGDIWLRVPEQVVQEVRRNRSAKIRESLDSLRKHKLSPTFPAYSKRYDRYSEFRSALIDADTKRAQLLEDIERDIENGTLPADLLIERMFAAGEKHSTTPEIVEAARLRVDLGQPPGKNGSIGDAVIWETILATHSDDLKLFFVSDDKDWYDVLRDDQFHSTLLSEWRTKFGTEFHAFRSLSEFVKSQYKYISFPGQYIVEQSIQALQSCVSPDDVVNILATLPVGEFLTMRQIGLLVDLVRSCEAVSEALREPVVSSYYIAMCERYPRIVEFCDEGGVVQSTLLELLDYRIQPQGNT
jgi:hypothetical protein